MRSIFVGCLVLLSATRCSLAQPAGSPSPEKTTLASVEISISVEASSCFLEYQDATGRQRVRLQTPPPCTFHRDPHGKVRVMHQANGDVVLVESSKRDPSHPGDCDTRLQAISGSASRITVGPHVSRVASCPPFQWESKMFQGLVAE